MTVATCSRQSLKHLWGWYISHPAGVVCLAACLAEDLQIVQGDIEKDHDVEIRAVLGVIIRSFEADQESDQGYRNTGSAHEPCAFLKRYLTSDRGDLQREEGAKRLGAGDEICCRTLIRQESLLNVLLLNFRKQRFDLRLNEIDLHAHRGKRKDSPFRLCFLPSVIPLLFDLLQRLVYLVAAGRQPVRPVRDQHDRTTDQKSAYCRGPRGEVTPCSSVRAKKHLSHFDPPDIGLSPNYLPGFLHT